MNVADFFGKASEIVARNDGTALVIGRISMIVFGAVAIIVLLMLIMWLARQCIGARPRSFEHFEDASWETTAFVPFLQAKLTNLNTLKKSLGDMSDAVENTQDSLEGAKENICTVTENIHDTYVNAHMSGIDPTLAMADKVTQDKRLASRKARAERGWKRREAGFTAKHGLPLVECFANTSTVASLIVQIGTACDDITDTLANITELGKSPEFHDIITQFIAIEGNIQFTNPFLENNATITGNTVATIRDMPKPDVTAKTEGFDGGNPDPDTYYKNKYSSLAMKEATTIAAASEMITNGSKFLDAVQDLVARSKNALDVDKKTKAAMQELKNGKVTPAYMDEKK